MSAVTTEPHWRAAQRHRRDNGITLDGYTAEDAYEAGWTAALDAAPTVDGWVWCEHRGTVGGDSSCLWPGDGCPGPHRTLLVGSPVLPIPRAGDDRDV